MVKGFSYYSTPPEKGTGHKESTPKSLSGFCVGLFPKLGGHSERIEGRMSSGRVENPLLIAAGLGGGDSVKLKKEKWKKTA